MFPPSPVPPPLSPANSHQVPPAFFANRDAAGLPSLALVPKAHVSSLLLWLVLWLWRGAGATGRPCGVAVVCAGRRCRGRVELLAHHHRDSRIKAWQSSSSPPTCPLPLLNIQSVAAEQGWCVCPPDTWAPGLCLDLPEPALREALREVKASVRHVSGPHPRSTAEMGCSLIHPYTLTSLYAPLLLQGPGALKDTPASQGGLTWCGVAAHSWGHSEP